MGRAINGGATRDKPVVHFQLRNNKGLLCGVCGVHGRELRMDI